MSKKNNRGTKARIHAFSLKREKEAALAKEAKARKAQEKQRTQAAGVSKPLQGKRKGGIRIRKGVRVKGIKIVDAASKRKALELLRAEQALEEMDVDSPKVVLKNKAKKSSKAAKPAKKVTVKLSAKPKRQSDEPVPMAM